MIRLRNVPLGLEEDESLLWDRARQMLKTNVTALRIARKAVDARRRSDVHFVYTLDVAVRDEASALAQCRDAAPAPANDYAPPTSAHIPAERPVVVGFGPAGMFAALALALAGLRPIVLERGQDAAARTETVERLRREGTLDPESNIQFGEGGAGAFSDGKLSTGVKDRRIPWVLDQLAAAGAPADITYEAKPHIGTDRLPGVCANIRRRIVALGGQVRFSTALLGLETAAGRLTGAVTARETIPCSSLILAVGHSARDTFEMLCDLIPMAPKPFAMGVRIEHRQSDIDRAQYGAFAGHPALGPADYALAVELPGGRRCYSFCMCPGGQVVPAASEPGMVCTNGASPCRRDLENANAALLVPAAPEDFPYGGPLGGMAWQRELERRAFEAAGGGYRAPAQTVGGFLQGGVSRFGRVRPSYEPGVTVCDLRQTLPPFITGTIADALPVFDRKLRGFAAADAVLTGPETRSSSPVRMLRTDSLESPALAGLYPCGEGAGWAGGIMSAAIDGLRCAEALIARLDGRPATSICFAGDTRSASPTDGRNS